ncbi:MAG: hypothetical protein Q4D87_03805 [Actinomycetaceae bacterium]|nr:hypothetical protein [Actinomycetaceae bacterium]
MDVPNANTISAMLEAEAIATDTNVPGYDTAKEALEAALNDEENETE